MINIGLIGCGRWGGNHARVFSQIDCNFVGISDLLPETKKIAEQYDVRYIKHYLDLLPYVDAVSIVTPTNTHFQIVKDCLLAGKHVLVEKPMTLNSKEAKELINIASKKNLKLGVGHLFRFNPIILRLKNVLHEIGGIHYITMRYIHSHKSPRKDSGTIFNFGSHLFDILNFVLEEKPKKIFCKKVNVLSDEREDCALILLDYCNFKVFLEVTWFHPLKRRDMWIIGSKEKIYVDLMEQKMKRYSIKTGLNKTVNFDCIDENLEFKEPLKEELKHFCDSIEKNKKLINDGIFGYKVIKMCESAIQSAKTGVEVTV